MIKMVRQKVHHWRWNSPAAPPRPNDTFIPFWTNAATASTSKLYAVLKYPLFKFDNAVERRVVRRWRRRVVWRRRRAARGWSIPPRSLGAAPLAWGRRRVGDSTACATCRLCRGEKRSLPAQILADDNHGRQRTTPTAIVSGVGLGKFMSGLRLGRWRSWPA